NCINPSFINVIEMHGKYDPVNEVTSNANSIVQKIQEIENSLEYNVIEIQLKTGKLLWTNKADAGVNAPPISYEIDGTQYIAVAAGGNSIFGFKEGDNILVYKLK
ncbi:MAG: hypothetical protein EBW51_08810, partial [Actinobacteria bacterium]|nr:hypothetical protein [Actinomycetota bacterium]